MDPIQSDTSDASGFATLTTEEVARIESILAHPKADVLRGVFNPSTGALSGEAPLVPVDARQIASVTSIRRHGA